jgi:hypothetical protein
VVDDFGKELAQRRPKKGARGTFLHPANASTYRADDDFDPLGIIRLSHPPYGPDLAPCDFWLFGNLKIKLERNTFTSARDEWRRSMRSSWIVLCMSSFQYLMNGSAELSNGLIQEVIILKLSKPPGSLLFR